MAFKFGDVRKSLKKKGFIETNGKHHVYLHHSHAGKETGPYTYVSYGKDSSDVDSSLLGQMKKQLGLGSQRDVENLVNCPMSSDQYIAYLKKTGVIIK